MLRIKFRINGFVSKKFEILIRENLITRSFLFNFQLSNAKIEVIKYFDEKTIVAKKIVRLAKNLNFKRLIGKEKLRIKYFCFVFK